MLAYSLANPMEQFRQVEEGALVTDVTFTQARYRNLATYCSNVNAVETPVWIALLDGYYYLFTAGSAGKVKRLRNAARSRIATCAAV